MKRRWLYWILIIAFFLLVITRFTEARKLLQTLANGKPQWIGVALLVQAVYYLVFTGVYQSALHTVEVPGRLLDMVPVWFTSIFLNITAPSVGVTGAAVFVDDAARRGHSPARATAGIMLVLVADYSAFALLLVAGLIFLFRDQHLLPLEVVAALILLAFILGLVSVLVLAVWRPVALHRFLNWLQSTQAKILARFHRPPILAEDWARRSAEEFSQAAAAIRAHPQRLARTFALAMAAHLVEMTTLWVLFHAFRQPVHFTVLLAGYSIGILFWLVAITPSGIGVVEGFMTIVLVSLGIPGESAALIALSFRGMTFWLPLLIGFFVMRRTKSFGAAPSAQSKGERV